MGERGIPLIYKTIIPRPFFLSENRGEGSFSSSGRTGDYRGNHTQMNGPIACELYFPGEAVHLVRLADDASERGSGVRVQGFLVSKPKSVRWFSGFCRTSLRRCRSAFSITPIPLRFCRDRRIVLPFGKRRKDFRRRKRHHLSRM